MSNFVPNSHHLREVLLHYFISKKTAAESNRILVKVYGEDALSETTCRDWFRRFKSGDFDLINKDRGKPPKKFENAELQALLDEDSTQTLKQLAKALWVDQGTISRRLHAIGKIQKEEKWVSYELKEKHWKAKNHLWNFVWSLQKKVIFASHCYWWWEVVSFKRRAVVLGRNVPVTAKMERSHK